MVQLQASPFAVMEEHSFMFMSDYDFAMAQLSAFKCQGLLIVAGGTHLPSRSVLGDLYIILMVPV